MGEIVGVLQVINKKSGSFSTTDEKLIESLNETVSAGILRCQDHYGMKAEYEDALASSKRDKLTQGDELQRKFEMEEMRSNNLEKELKEMGLEKERIISEKERKLSILLAEQKDETELETIEGLKQFTNLTSELARRSSKKGRKKLDSLLLQISDNACKFMKAERSTIFFYDKKTDVLWSKVAKGGENIRFSASTGIAGKVCKSKALSNVKDPSLDPNFNPSIDKSTGFVTKNILAVPILGSDGSGYDSDGDSEDHQDILGVLQILNKLDGTFSSKDEQKAILLTKQISSAMLVHVKNEHERDERIRTMSAGSPSMSPRNSPRNRGNRTSSLASFDGSILSMDGSTSPVAGRSLGADKYEYMSPSAGGATPRGFRSSLGGGGNFVPPSLRLDSGDGKRLSPSGKLGVSSGVADSRTILQLSDFFHKMTSESTLVSIPSLCELVSAELPHLLKVTNVSLWLLDDDGHTLWNKTGENEEKVAVNASDGILGSCIHGRRSTRLVKPTWAELGTMRIPGMPAGEAVSLVVCVPVEVGGSIVGALQCVSIDQEIVAASADAMGSFFANIIGYTLMMMKVSRKFSENEMMIERVCKVGKSVRGAQVILGGAIDRICEDFVKDHVKGLLGKSCDCTLFMSNKDEGAGLLSVPGKDGWPKMELNDESSMIGRCGWLGITQLYNNIAAHGGDGVASVSGGRGEDRTFLSPGALAVSPLKLMMSIGKLEGGGGNVGVSTDASSYAYDSGRVSPLQQKFNDEAAVGTVCLALILPFSEQNKMFGVVNKDGNICVGVLRVTQKAGRVPFTDCDVRVLQVYASQLVVAICGILLQGSKVEEVVKESALKHKRDKKVAYSWKKICDSMVERCAKVGELCSELIAAIGGGSTSGRRPREGEEDMLGIITDGGKNILSCTQFGVILREEINARMVTADLDIPKDLILGCLRRGEVVKRGDGKSSSSSFLCYPIWNDTDSAGVGTPYGAICAARTAKEFTEQDEVTVGILAGVLGMAIACGGGDAQIRKMKAGGAASNFNTNKRRKESYEEREANRGDRRSAGSSSSSPGDWDEVEGLLDASSVMGQAMTFDHLAQNVSSVTKSLVENCGVYLYSLDAKSRSMRPLFPGVVKSVSTSAGILGYVATTGRAEIVTCAKLHRLFDAAADCHSRINDSQPMFYRPLLDARKKVIGVLQVVGRDRSEGFNDFEVDKIERLAKGAEDGLARCILMESLTEESYSFKSALLVANEEIEALKKRAAADGENQEMEKGRLIR